MLAIISDERSAFDVDYLRLNRRVLAPNFAATLAPEMPIVEPRNSLPVPELPGAPMSRPNKIDMRRSFSDLGGTLSRIFFG